MTTTHDAKGHGNDGSRPSYAFLAKRWWADWALIPKPSPTCSQVISSSSRASTTSRAARTSRSSRSRRATHALAPPFPRQRESPRQQSRDRLAPPPTLAGPAPRGPETARWHRQRRRQLGHPTPGQAHGHSRRNPCSLGPSPNGRSGPNLSVGSILARGGKFDGARVITVATVAAGRCQRRYGARRRRIPQTACRHPSDSGADRGPDRLGSPVPRAP